MKVVSIENGDYKPAFEKFLAEYGLKHPLFLPNETDKLVLELFFLEGLTLGVNLANDVFAGTLVIPEEETK